GTWPPALNIFLNLLERGKIDDARRMPDGSLLAFEKIYPLDAAYDTLADAPEEIRGNKRYKDVGDFSVAGLAHRLAQDLGERPLDIVVHSLANGPEVKKPLLETSRLGYLAAVSVSAYSLVSLVARLAPRMRPSRSRSPPARWRPRPPSSPAPWAAASRARRSTWTRDITRWARRWRRATCSSASRYC